MEFFDTHAHYTADAFDADRNEVLSSLPGAGVTRVVEMGCDLASSHAAVALAAAYDFVYAAVGVHPEQAAEVSADDLVAIEALYAHEKVVAVGEIGLDYHYGTEHKARQKEIFAYQLEMARRLDLPVCVHDREAHADTLDILRSVPGVRGVFHCYSGSLEMTRDVLNLGFVFGFGGVITFKNAKKYEPILKSLPPESILLETDCPYLAPDPFRGKRNDSSLLYRVCETIAELRGLSDEETAALTYENAAKFYRIP